MSRATGMNSWFQANARAWARSPLLTGFIASILLHLLLFALWRFGVLELPDRFLQLFIRRKIAAVQPARKPSATNSVPVVKEIPLTFIEIEPDAATPKPPPDVRFYSKANSVAANPKPKADLALPKIEGRQDKVAKLHDTPRAVLPPPPPPPTPAPAPKPAPPPQPLARNEIDLKPTPKETPPPGNTRQDKPQELAKATPPKPDKPPEKSDKPDTPSKSLQPEPPKESIATDNASTLKTRPRSLAAARQQAGIAGEKMRQEGGVRRAGKLSVDAKATPFGEYDAALIRAIQERWYALIDSSTLTPRSGKVVLEFNLMYDGRISEMKLMETEVGEALAYLCERAVTDPSPYPKWPLDMHRMIGGNIRPVKLTFFYF
jgi:hypothetical protein